MPLKGNVFYDFSIPPAGKSSIFIVKKFHRWDRWCSHLLHRKISYTATWDACIKPCAKKKKEDSLLVGGFNPFEKKSSNWIIPQIGVNIKKTIFETTTQTTSQRFLFPEFWKKIKPPAWPISKVPGFRVSKCRWNCGTGAKRLVLCWVKRVFFCWKEVAHVTPTGNKEHG